MKLEKKTNKSGQHGLIKQYRQYGDGPSFLLRRLPTEIGCWLFPTDLFAVTIVVTHYGVLLTLVTNFIRSYPIRKDLIANKKSWYLWKYCYKLIYLSLKAAPHSTDLIFAKINIWSFIDISADVHSEPTIESVFFSKFFFKWIWTIVPETDFPEIVWNIRYINEKSPR